MHEDFRHEALFYEDFDEFLARPARIMPAWRRFVSTHSRPGGCGTVAGGNVVRLHGRRG